MKKITILLLFVGLLAACNNNSKTDTTDKDKEKKDRDTTIKKDEPEPGDSVKNYTWTEADQNKFLKDCERESEENIIKGKLKDFCRCMLTEAQKYYPSYKEMDQKSDEDHDEEIFKKCVGEYGEDND